MATTFKVVDFYRNNSTSKFDFNLCGGYLTDLPATICDIDDENRNENLEKVRLRALNSTILNGLR